MKKNGKDIVNDKVWDSLLKERSYGILLYFGHATLFLTNDEKDDRQRNGDDDDPRSNVLQPGFSLRSPCGLPKFIPGHIQTIACLLQIFQSLTTIDDFLHIITHYIAYFLYLQSNTLNINDSSIICGDYNDNCLHTLHDTHKKLFW